MTRSPRAAALLLLLALAVHGASAICGPDWTRLKIRHGKVVGPFMPDDAVAMATISEDTFRQIRGGISRCKLLSTDILRACKKVGGFRGRGWVPLGLQSAPSRRVRPPRLLPSCTPTCYVPPRLHAARDQEERDPVRPCVSVQNLRPYAPLVPALLHAACSMPPAGMPSPSCFVPSPAPPSHCRPCPSRPAVIPSSSST